MAEETVTVEGMSCEHCVETITKALGRVAGVRKVFVNLEEKNVFVDYDDAATNLEEISDHIAAVGFKVK